MGKPLVTSAHKKIYKETVEQLRKDLGRKVQLHYPGSRVQCGNCLFDIVNKRSAGIYSPRSPYPSGQPGPTPFQKGQCPICNGVGQYTQTIIKEILCHVRWGKSQDKSQEELAGTSFDFDCRLQADIKHQAEFLRAQVKIVVDGTPMEVVKLYPRGLGTLIQVIVFLKASEFNVPGNATRTTYGGPQ